MSSGLSSFAHCIKDFSLSLTSQASLRARINRLISGNKDYVFWLPDLLMILRCLSADPHHIVKEVESIYKNILSWGHSFCLCPGHCSEYIHHGLLLSIRENIARSGGVAWERRKEASTSTSSSSGCIKSGPGQFYSQTSSHALAQDLNGTYGLGPNPHP